MITRKAKKEDLKKITDNNLLLAFESENKYIDYKTVFNGVKSIIEDDGKGFYLVTEKNNKIIGQLMITYEWSDWNNKFVWWIQSVYVDKCYRNIGVFKNLLNTIKIMAKENNINKLKLYVHKNNKNAKMAYSKIGMKKILFDIYEGEL